MINYVIATWSGSRRFDIPEAVADRGFFLREHFRVLAKYRFSQISQITVAVPDNPDEPPEFTKALAELPTQVQSAKVHIFRRPNVGLSYGSWSDAYGQTRTQFDHYLFMEDDYCCCMDDFDKAMLALATPNVGYVAGLVRRWQLPLHAGNANGLIPSHILERLWQRYNMLPHYTETAEYGRAEAHGQVGLSQAIVAMGYELFSLTDRYTSIFRHGWCPDGQTGSGPIIMMPLGHFPGKPENMP